MLKSSLTNLPLDVLVLIIDTIIDETDEGRCSTVCLGLTCPELYSIVKPRYPEPIKLYIGVPFMSLLCFVLTAYDSSYMTRLARFIGPRYRASTTLDKFLSCEAFDVRP